MPLVTRPLLSPQKTSLMGYAAPPFISPGPSRLSSDVGLLSYLRHTALTPANRPTSVPPPIVTVANLHHPLQTHLSSPSSQIPLLYSPPSIFGQAKPPVGCLIPATGDHHLPHDTICRRSQPPSGTSTTIVLPL